MIRDLAQGIIFAAWFVGLFRYQPLRKLIGSAPRRLTVPVGLLTAAWLLVQLTDQRSRYFPILSVYMYGNQRPPAQSMRGIALHGTWCDGKGARLDLAFMGLARARSRFQRLQADLSSVRTAADSAKRTDMLDRVLMAIGRAYNREFPDRPLCSIGLDEVRVTADQYRSGVMPPARVVHVVALR